MFNNWYGCSQTLFQPQQRPNTETVIGFQDLEVFVPDLVPDLGPDLGPDFVNKQIYVFLHQIGCTSNNFYLPNCLIVTYFVF